MQDVQHIQKGNNKKNLLSINKTKTLTPIKQNNPVLKVQHTVLLWMLQSTIFFGNPVLKYFTVYKSPCMVTSLLKVFTVIYSCTRDFCIMTIEVLYFK